VPWLANDVSIRCVTDPHDLNDDLVARADALRPQLLEEQAATEERAFYSEEMHEAFREAGFYRLHVPRHYGGLEQSIATFYRVIMSISRGCPSTGWMLSLGAGHAQQAAAFWPREAQDDFFGNDGHFVASASYQWQDAFATPVDGGYRVRGTWHFCSGVPYATHHMGLLPTKSEGIGIDDLIVIMVPRDQFRMLDNWGDLIGLKGSGSHSVVVEETVIPERWAIPLIATETPDRRTTGQELYGNPLYGGRFSGFAVGRLTAIQVGNAQAAVDEFVRLMDGRRMPTITGESPLKTENVNYQRSLGLATAWTDAAYSIMERVGDLYVDWSRAVEDGELFTDEKVQRIYGQQLTAARLCWEAGELVFRAGSTTGARDGQRLQRLWRDLCAFRTNGIHQHDFRAAALGQALLGFPVDFL
jgi:3-hydroxy-9,10-secoandrosta-1,3,5(10)-triene-9,17-dione monooxygenase